MEGDVFREVFSKVWTGEHEKSIAKCMLVLSDESLDELAKQLDGMTLSGNSGFREYIDKENLKRIVEK